MSGAASPSPAPPCRTHPPEHAAAAVAQLVGRRRPRLDVCLAGLADLADAGAGGADAKTARQGGQRGQGLGVMPSVRQGKTMMCQVWRGPNRRRSGSDQGKPKRLRPAVLPPQRAHPAASSVMRSSAPLQPGQGQRGCVLRLGGWHCCSACLCSKQCLFPCSKRQQMSLKLRGSSDI